MAADRKSRDEHPRPTYVTTLLGNGEFCPISELMGRRRVRCIDADSVEGRRLLRQGLVTVQTRDGRRFHGVPVARILDRLVDEVSREVRDRDTDPRVVPDLDRVLATLDRQRRTYS